MRYETHDLTEEEGAPTPERARIANGSLQKLDLYDKNSRTPIATAYKINSVLDKLLANDQITEAMHSAGERFHEDYVVGRCVKMTGKYGLAFEMAAAIGPTAGTPVSQLTAEALARLPDSTKSANRFYAAYKAIGHKETADAIVAVVCEGSATLTDIGRSWTNYGSVKQQSAAGLAQFKIGLDMLADVYGTKVRRK
jgi:hypothetical protein